jgi:hypothetical protein
MDYQLKPLGKACAATGQPLAPGSICHSVVVERGGQLVRLDFSEAGWNGPPPDTIGHWVQRIPLSKTSTNFRIDFDALLRYFEQLCEQPDPAHDRHRYAAALLLLKHKRLKLDGIGPGQLTGDECLLLSGTHGEGHFEVPHLGLDDAALQVAEHELRIQLSAEWSA